MNVRWEKPRAWWGADWGVLLRCLWVIPAVECSVRWRAPRHWLPRAPAARTAPAEDPATLIQGHRVARWVDAAYRRSPFTPTCLTRSLVLYRILRARGIPCRLHIGLRKTGQAELQGHAWTEPRPAGAGPDGFEVILSY